MTVISYQISEGGETWGVGFSAFFVLGLRQKI
jgi:hypothetical protein